MVLGMTDLLAGLFKPTIAEEYVAAFAETKHEAVPAGGMVIHERLIAVDDMGRMWMTQWRQFSHSFDVPGDIWEETTADRAPTGAVFIGNYPKPAALRA